MRMHRARPRGRRSPLQTAGAARADGARLGRHARRGDAGRRAQPCRQDFPGRDFMLVAAFAVILVTVLVQGTTLGRVIRWAGLSEPEAERPLPQHVARPRRRWPRRRRSSSSSAPTTAEGKLIHPQLLERYQKKATGLADYAEPRGGLRPDPHRPFRPGPGGDRRGAGRTAAAAPWRRDRRGDDAGAGTGPGSRGAQRPVGQVRPGDGARWRRFTARSAPPVCRSARPAAGRHRRRRQPRTETRDRSGALSRSASGREASRPARHRSPGG